MIIKRGTFQIRCNDHGIQDCDIWEYMIGIYSCPICYQGIPAPITNRPVVRLKQTPIEVEVPILAKPKSNAKPKKHIVYDQYDMGHWVYHTTVIPTDWQSFAYELRFIELGYTYIGIKSFGGGSQWQSYQSSSTLVAEIIEAGHTPSYTMTMLFTSWDDAKLYETAQLVTNDVPNNPSYLNIVVDWSKPSRGGLCEDHYKNLRTYRS